MEYGDESQKADDPRRKTNATSTSSALRKPMIVSRSSLDQSSAIG
jgi:hypothetical protein